MFEDFEDVEKEEGVDFRTLFRLRLELLLGETLVREGVALRRALRLGIFNKKYYKSRLFVDTPLHCGFLRERTGHKNSTYTK